MFSKDWSIKTKNGRLQTTLFKKQTDCKNYQHVKPVHPYSLKNNTSSQALKIMKKYYTFPKNTDSIQTIYQNCAKRLQKT